MEALQDDIQNTVDEHSKNEVAEKIDRIDFTMVTFSLAGKEYGIDIMKVQSISKASRFTFVPNAAPFVRGVYNLRGDIISVIDLRIMFHLPAAKIEEGGMENMIILRLENYYLGVIVDSIDKVVGISSEDMQPPHPLFGDINIKYIKGVVENDERLYIVLDVEKILGENDDDDSEIPVLSVSEVQRPKVSASGASDEDLDLNFIIETLQTFKKFTVSPVNNDWIKKRYAEWRGERKSDLQLKDINDAEAFIAPYYSPSTNILWDNDYRSELLAVLPEIPGGTVHAWNPGCGKGYETFSFATVLRERYSSARIKIWANDNDLLSISTAPNLVFQKTEIPEIYDKYIVEGKNGFQFRDDIKDIIMFEYHDILNQNPFPSVDVIIARDMLSFLNISDQERLLKEFWDKLKPKGVLILGQNEQAPFAEWEQIRNGNVLAYRKKNE